MFDPRQKWAYKLQEKPTLGATTPHRLGGISMAAGEFGVHTADLEALASALASHGGKIAGKSMSGSAMCTLPASQAAHAAEKTPQVFEHLMHATASRLREMAAAARDNAAEYDKVDKAVEATFHGAISGRGGQPGGGSAGRR